MQGPFPLKGSDNGNQIPTQKIEHTFCFKNRHVMDTQDTKDTPATMTTEPISDTSPGAELTAQPTWSAAYGNPDPSWIHLEGVPGAEHLVEAVLTRPPPIITTFPFPPEQFDGEATPPARAHLSGPIPRQGPAPSEIYTPQINTEISNNTPPESVEGPAPGGGPCTPTG